jgi:hypothetical protein
MHGPIRHVDFERQASGECESPTPHGSGSNHGGLGDERGWGNLPGWPVGMNAGRGSATTCYRDRVRNQTPPSDVPPDRSGGHRPTALFLAPEGSETKRSKPNNLPT